MDRQRERPEIGLRISVAKKFRKASVVTNSDGCVSESGAAVLCTQRCDGCERLGKVTVAKNVCINMRASRRDAERGVGDWLDGRTIR